MVERGLRRRRADTAVGPLGWDETYSPPSGTPGGVAPVPAHQYAVWTVGTAARLCDGTTTAASSAAASATRRAPPAREEEEQRRTTRPTVTFPRCSPGPPQLRPRRPSSTVAPLTS